MISKTTSVHDIIAGNKALESVIERLGFEKRNLHFRLEDLCLLHNTDADFVILVIKAFSEGVSFPADELKSFSLELTLDYLKKTHNFYLNKKIPEIELSFASMCRDFSYSHPQLLILAKLFMDYKKDLVEHIDDEEYVLFPYIEELIKVKQKGKSVRALGLDRYSIENFHDEHHHEEEILTQIRETIEARFRKNRVPMPFRIFLNQIEMLEIDLLIHARIEDEVLIPLARGLEKEVKSN